ncbi:MAG: S-layer homology domain-containing protein, partial [Bacillota bacterium]
MNGRKVAVLVVAAALASAILICPASACAVPFSDVSGGEYYSEAAYWLGRAGIFAGDEEGRLNAGAVFSRAHMAVVLARITGQEGLTEVLSTHQTGWVDDVLIPPWARGAFALAEARGWFVGRADGTVAPDAPLTWAEIAMLLVRITDNEHLLSGEWPQSAVDAARAMGAFSGLPEGPVPDLPVLRGQVVVVIWAAVRTPTRLGLSDEGESLLSLHHSAIAEVYRLRDRDESGGSLTVEAA